ncbi:hypothetical protein V2J09_013051 [Rumex salicifolius]
MSRAAATTTNLDLKQRVLTCLDRLADRDTLAQATAELDLIARSLSPETSLSPFLSCLLSVDSSYKSPVRVHSVRLISSLAASHGPHLSPHVPKILSSSLLRRLRDSDTAVRSACSDVSSSLARHVTSSPIKAILDPLLAALLAEQDYNVQIGAAVCLSAAIESSESVDASELRRTLPKMLKLAKSDGFRAKPALLALIGSVVATDGGGVVNGPGLMANVVSCAVELLSSDDWAARKAAAEVLEKVAVAVAQRHLVVEVKTMCLNALEKRKFDKVKIAREAMSRAIEAWKAVNEMYLEDPPLSHHKSSSSKDKSNGINSSPVSSDDQSFGFETPEPKKNWAKGRLSLSDSSTVTVSTSNSNGSGDSSSETPHLDKSLSKSRSSVSSLSDDSTVQTASGKKSSSHRIRKSHVRKPLDSKFDVWGAQDEDNIHVRDGFEQRKLDPVDYVKNSSGTVESSSQKTFNNSLYEDVGHNPVTRRFGSRVVTSQGFHDSQDIDGRTIDGNSEDIEDISVIRNQLIQIERQQANLMKLVQTFMGNSQSGINSLETRVSGLEKALDGISRNLAIQGCRIPNESARNLCCNIHGAELLSQKFWRKNETDRYATSNPCFSGTMHSAPQIDNNVEIGDMQVVTQSEFPRDANSSIRALGAKGTSLRRACSGGSLDGASPRSCNAPVVQRT